LAELEGGQFGLAYASGLAFGLWHFGGRRNGWLVCGLLLPFFAFPYAGECAVWGFDSMWYFPYVFALVAIAGLGFCRAGSRSWWIGLAAALLGLFTQSLGPVAPAAIGGLMVLRVIRNRKCGRDNLITLGACLLLVDIGAALDVREKDPNPLQAHSFAEFTTALIRQLDWPFYNLPGAACIIVLPPALLLVYYLRPGFQALRMAELLLTLALWSLLDSALVAFGRADYGEIIPSSRYTEIFGLLLIASLFATILLGEQWRQSRVLSWTGRLLPLVFAGIIFWGIARMSNLVVDNLLVPTRIMNLIAEERVATFMATGNESALLERPTIRPDPKVAGFKAAGHSAGGVFPRGVRARGWQAGDGLAMAVATGCYDHGHGPCFIRRAVRLWPGPWNHGVERRETGGISRLAGRSDGAGLCLVKAFIATRSGRIRDATTTGR